MMIIPARESTVIAAMTAIAEGIASEDAKRNDTEVEVEETTVNILATKMTMMAAVQGVTPVIANPTGEIRGENGKKMSGGKRSVANERTRNAAAMIIRRHPPPKKILAIHHTTKEESQRRRRKRKRRKVASRKSAGV